MMNRRDVIAMLGGAATAWPLGADAQQNAMPVVGYLSGASANSYPASNQAFRDGLKDTGYVEGRNVTIAPRWAEGHYERFPDLARDLVNQGVSVLVAPGSSISALAAEEATSKTSIPVVFMSEADPVKIGLVASLNRPGGNATGVSSLFTSMTAKRLQLFHDLVPQRTLAALLLNPANVSYDAEIQEAEAAAAAVHMKLAVFHAGNDGELGAALSEVAKSKAEGLIIGGDSFLNGQRELLIAFAAQQRIPALADNRDFAVAGGLMSYGPSLAAMFRQMGVYTGKILGGTRPADLPVVQPTKFDLVINLKTAKALDLIIPPTLLAIADEVIE
jgi:putative ABC transport system substrate-binding protein